MQTPSDSIRGALFMIGAMTAFTINDAFMKGLAGQIPPFQAIFLRGLGVILFLVVLCAAMGQLRFRFAAKDWFLAILRAVAEAGGALLFITALFNMPFANLSAILQALPLTVSLGAAIFLKEPLGWRRLLAIGVGFCGVLLIIKPGSDGFTIYSLCGVGTVVLATIRDLAVRRMTRDVPSMMIGLIAATGVTIGAGIGSLFQPWLPVLQGDLYLLGGAMAFVAAAYTFSVAAMRVGEIGFIAPFRYTSLLVALFLGLVIFGEWPDTLTLVGAAIVTATGLFTLYREARVKKRERQVLTRFR